MKKCIVIFALALTACGGGASADFKPAPLPASTPANVERYDIGPLYNGTILIFHDDKRGVTCYINTNMVCLPDSQLKAR